MNTFVYGLATIAASVGYVYTRKTISNSRIPKQANEDLEAALLEKEIASSIIQEKITEVESDMVLEIQTEILPESVDSQIHPEPEHAPTSRRASLKRKSIDDHYPVDANDSAHRTDIALIPCKRTRTPTNGTDGEGDAKFADYVLVQLSKGSQPEIELIDLVAHEAECAAQHATIDSDVDEGSDGESSSLPARAGSQPASEFPLPPEPPRSPSPALSQSAPEEQIKTPIPMFKSSPRGFASFAGPNQAFQTFGSNPFGASRVGTGFGGLGVGKGQAAWCVVNDLEEGECSNSRLSQPVLAFGGNDKPVTGTAGTASGVPSSSKQKSSDNQVTGEEDEDVKAEIKGVRLYIKRGQNDFTSHGMAGTLRLLAEKSGSSERLLFRRDPLWQVSMNVCINAGVRCSFDKEEKVLRFTLTEIDAQTSEQEVVVYAYKPGKATSKQDFIEFGERLAAHTKLTRS